MRSLKSIYYHVGPIVYLCQGFVDVGIDVDIGTSAVPNESGFPFEVVWRVKIACIRPADTLLQEWRFSTVYGLFPIINLMQATACFNRQMSLIERLLQVSNKIYLFRKIIFLKYKHISFIISNIKNVFKFFTKLT